MSDVALVSEISARYPSEWVLLEDPELGRDLAVQGGRVLAHSKDRDEVYRAARGLRPRHAAVIFTGRIPEDAVVVLCASHLTRPQG